MAFQKKLDVRISPAEHNLFGHAARAAGMTLSAWVRYVCREAARGNTVPNPGSPGSIEHAETLRRFNNTDERLLKMEEFLERHFHAFP